MGVLYFKYGYLIQSAKNFPRKTDDIETSVTLDVQRETAEELTFITVPDGFSVEYFAYDVPGARSMTMSNNGIVYVGTRSEGVVYALIDENMDGYADERVVVAKDLNTPNGVAWKDGDLYVAEIERIIVYRDIDETYGDHPAYEVLYDKLPKDVHHGWRFIDFGPDGKLYVSIGAPCNICEEDEPFGTIIRMSDNFDSYDVVAKGVRNSVGFGWDQDSVMWFTDNGRDWSGDDIPPDELNVLRTEGEHFGFPYCHGSRLEDTEYGNGKDCEDYSAPVLELGPHVAALGIEFLSVKNWPEEYDDMLLIAEHGSWNRTVPIGYRIMMTKVSEIRAEGYDVFAEGWLDEEGSATGRPVDVMQLDDNSIILSDDKADAIYKVSYK